jgi:phage terminase large subunit
MTIEPKVNVVFDHLRESENRFIVEQGGTRSGKTYNILLWIIFWYCTRNRGKMITICRKHGPSLRGSAMRDFFSILTGFNLYSEILHSKSKNEYRLFGNIIEFLSLDEPQKVRGRKRDICFINEGNELTYEDFFQLNIRTSERLIIDYNPSDEYHWIYDEVVPRDDCDFHVTTYKDNPFLEKSLIQEIERLKDVDEVYWKIYGEGQRAANKAVIFSFDTIKSVPENAKFLSMGLDFGYTNDPTALVEIWMSGDTLIFNELIYETGLTNKGIAQRMRGLGVERTVNIWADSAEPKTIDEIHKWGFNVKPAKKGKDSVNIGIDMLRRYRLAWTEKSTNGIKEMRNYKWQEDKNGKLLNTPVDLYNHLIDAVRYGVYMSIANPNRGKYALR